MSERLAVQNPLIKYAGEIGWEIVSQEKALVLRGGETGLFFRDILEAQLVRLNPRVVDAGRAGDVMRRLSLLKPNIEGNRDVMNWLRGEGSVFVPEETRERNVRLIDFDNLANNSFHVTDEWRHKSTVYANRADVVFLINGIPVAVCETKAAGKQDSLAEGVEQMRRYHRETPEMLMSAQVFQVTQLLDFFYAPTWSTSRKNVFNWKEESDATNYEGKVKAFFDRQRFLQLLKSYIIFLAKDDELAKIILRQHQTSAVEKVIDRVLDPVKRRGLVWHTQGSGKTLTMLTIASRLLREAPNEEKPTVLMIVDRNELEAQLFKNVTAYGIGNVEIAQNKLDLVRLLRDDYRGLIVSMVHKFDGIPASVNDRPGVTVLVDEAHRTTGGDLGNYLLAAAPNATFIGFTGTPIDNLAHGKGTFKVFGTDDERGYLDKYSIAESIADGTTVKLNYALAPSDLLVDRNALEKHFLNLAETEGISDIEELNAILDRAVELKEMMKADARVDKIAQEVARHFKENVEPMGFKAFLVAVDREACALYKKALDKYLPTEYSKVVYSAAHNDPAALKEYYLSPEEEKAVRKDFASKAKLPKILIVTEKLLTGYDAPILYCMYLDKPMRDHTLLQAIARVNRPYEDETGLVKPYGFVFDFMGIFEKLESALAFDSDVVASVIQNIDVLKELFATYMRETAPQYLSLARGWDDKAKERAITFFELPKTREDFNKFFRQLQSLYEILSPDAFLRPYIENYGKLAELYALIRTAYGNRIYTDKELTAKTRELLRQFTTSENLELPNAVHELSATELAALKRADASDTTKILNLKKILQQTVNLEGGSKPFLLSIGDRAEALAELYEDRKITTQQALADFEALMQEAVEARAERDRLKIDENSFGIYTALRPSVPELSAKQAVHLNQLFVKYPDYLWNESQKAQLRGELYKSLMPLVSNKNFVEAANSILKLQRV